MKILFLLALLLVAPTPALSTSSNPPQADDAVAPIASTTVGMRVRVDELRIKGSQLRAKPVVDMGKADVIVRVINVFPHGNDFRYNLEITPFVEGTVDLRDHLERIDESPLEGVDPLVVEVGAVLEAEVLLPHDLDVPQPGGVGGYRTRMIVYGVLWGIGLLAILLIGRKRAADGADREEAKPLTLADRLQPLVEGARSGELSTGQRAELERLLLAHWRDRRDLVGVHVAEAVSRLRHDEEAGPLFIQLEVWLHSPSGRPSGDADTTVDVAALLEPYRHVADTVGAGSAG